MPVLRPRFRRRAPSWFEYNMRATNEQPESKPTATAFTFSWMRRLTSWISLVAPTRAECASLGHGRSILASPVGEPKTWAFVAWLAVCSLVVFTVLVQVEWILLFVPVLLGLKFIAPPSGPRRIHRASRLSKLAYSIGDRTVPTP